MNKIKSTMLAGLAGGLMVLFVYTLIGSVGLHLGYVMGGALTILLVISE